MLSNGREKAQRRRRFSRKRFVSSDEMTSQTKAYSENLDNSYYMERVKLFQERWSVWVSKVNMLRNLFLLIENSVFHSKVIDLTGPRILLQDLNVVSSMDETDTLLH